MAPCLIRPRRSEHEGCAVALPKTWDDRFSLTTSHLYSTERQLRVDCGSWCSVRTFELLPTMRFRVLPRAVYCGSSPVTAWSRNEGIQDPTIRSRWLLPLEIRGTLMPERPHTLSSSWRLYSHFYCCTRTGPGGSHRSRWRHKAATSRLEIRTLLNVKALPEHVQYRPCCRINVI